MSGGQFNGAQWQFESIAEEIQNVAREYNDVYTVDTINKMKETVKLLLIAKAAVDAIDYLVSSDIGEDTFVIRFPNIDITKGNDE